MMVMPPVTDPQCLTRKAARLHSRRGAEVLIALHAGEHFSIGPCLELTRRASALVLRRERGGGIVRDLVLEGRSGPSARWMGHWLIRLDALRASVGRTTTLILTGDIATHGAALEQLTREGAELRRCPIPLSRGAVPCR